MVKQICFYLLAKKKRLIKALDQERTILVPPLALVEYMAITLNINISQNVQRTRALLCDSKQ